MFYTAEHLQKKEVTLNKAISQRCKCPPFICEGFSNKIKIKINCTKCSCTQSICSSKHCWEKLRWILQRTGGRRFTSLSSDCLKQSWQQCGAPSRRIGGAPLEEEGVAGVTDSDWFWWGRQRELIVRAAVTENLPTVPTVMLSSRDGEFLLTQLAMAGLFVLQPNLTPLKSFVGFFYVLNLHFGLA